MVHPAKGNGSITVNAASRQCMPFRGPFTSLNGTPPRQLVVSHGRGDWPPAWPSSEQPAKTAVVKVRCLPRGNKCIAHAGILGPAASTLHGARERIGIEHGIESGEMCRDGKYHMTDLFAEPVLHGHA